MFKLFFKDGQVFAGSLYVCHHILENLCPNHLELSDIFISNSSSAAECMILNQVNCYKKMISENGDTVDTDTD